MADNVAITAGTGTTIAADDIGGVLHQRVKLSQGADGSATDVSSAAPLHVTLANTGANSNKILTTPDLPSGASTSAKQDTIITHAATIAGAVSGTEMQVDVLTMPTVAVTGTFWQATQPVSIATVPSHAVTNAGTFAVQVDGSALTSLQLIDDTVFTDDAAFTAATSKVLGVGGIVTSDSVDSGDIGAFAMLANRQQKVTLYDSAGAELSVGGGTQYTEDAAAAANPVGNAINLIRSDTPATQTTADGDNIAQRGTNYGAAYVQLVTSAGAYIDSVGGGTEYTEDAAAAANPVGKALTLVRDDARAGSLTTADGDNVAARGTNAGELYVKHVDTIAVTQSGTWDEIGINDSGNSITIDNAALSVTGSGTATGAQRVEIANNGTGVIATVSAVTAITNALPAGTNNIGDVDVLSINSFAAHDAAVAGNPLVMAGVASAAAPTDVSADQDVVRAWHLRNGAAATVLTAAGALIGGDATNGLDVDVTRSALPTGASTLAEQQSQTTHLATIAGDTTDIEAAVELIDDAIVADDAAFTPATTKVMMAGFEFDDSSPDSVNEGDAGAARMSANRNIYTTIRDAAGNERGLNVDSNGAIAITVASIPSHAVTNAGTFAVQVDGNALTALQLIDNTILVDDAAFTPATSSVNMAGFQADESSTDSVDEGDAGAARMTLDRKIIVTAQPHTSGGLTTMNATSSDGGTALTNSAQAIKASAGQLYGYYIYNPNATAQFVQFYNTASGSVTVGTTNPLFMLTIPATSAANLMFTNGVEFTNAGFSWAATSTAGGNGAPGTALDAVAWYK